MHSLNNLEKIYSIHIKILLRKFLDFWVTAQDTYSKISQKRNSDCVAELKQTD